MIMKFFSNFLKFIFSQVLLHLWVMVVLLTYQPEMHGSENNVQPQPPK